MPAIVRKLLIVAALDGLVLQPVSTSTPAQKPTQTQQTPRPLKISYKSHQITSLPGEHDETGHGSSKATSLEAYGIIGLLNISSLSFLIAVSQKQQVAQIRGRSVYAVTDVTLVPLSSQTEAQNALRQAREAASQGMERAGTSEHKKEDKDTTAASDSEDSDRAETSSVISEHDLREDDDLTLPSTPNESIQRSPKHQRQSSIAEDVIGKKGVYGRFAERWFSRRGWTVERRRMQGMSTEQISDSETSNEVENAEPKDEDNQQDEASGNVSVTSTLLPKLLRTTRLLLASKNFYFSYDYDLTRRIGTLPQNLSQPLHRTVDPQYFWNRHLADPLIQAHEDGYVLPLLQGFVSQCTFAVQKSTSSEPDHVVKVHQETEDVIEDQENEENLAAPSETMSEESHQQGFLLTLISRRSVERAGLRYLRRGVDDEGHTANSVETEQILSGSAWDLGSKIYSFTQLRGSMPLYFTQSPYAFKPVPELHRSAETNFRALRKHFGIIASRYGPIQVACLTEKHGVEAKIGEEFQSRIRQLNEQGGVNGSKVEFEWFDFHDACRGMKFENVSQLVDKLDRVLTNYGFTIQQNGKIEQRQNGLIRTNCMDCLDRTNVAQSAFARKALEMQLLAQGFDLELQKDQTTQWFNTIWADNGDAVSKQYSSTAALKGDYTRTRKRDYRGALNDFGLTLSRYYNNIVNDYFSQAAIDYLLGNVSSQVFEEFEANMMSADPSISVDKIRQNAIDTSAKIVVADQTEELLGGWALLSPRAENTIRTLPFTEIILLLTDAALYSVRFDWHTEKVSSFERVAIYHIQQVQWGTYITSTLAAAHTDSRRNVGLVVRYKPGKEDIVRVNTRSLKSDVLKSAESTSGTGSHDRETLTGEELVSSTATTKPEGKGKAQFTTQSRILAFKAPPAQSAPQEKGAVQEEELIRYVCAEIARVISPNEEAAENRLVEKKDIMPYAEAKRSTGLFEMLGYEIKKLVWA